MHTCRSCRNDITARISEMRHDHRFVSVFGVEIFDGHRNASFEHLSKRCLKIKNDSDVNLCSCGVESICEMKEKKMKKSQAGDS